MMFQKFPPEIYSVVSKNHCVITAKRKRVPIIVTLAVPKPARPDMIAETLCMNDLKENLPVYSENTSKRKKNPRIMVNGEKVVDSDIEEKKERRQG